MKRTCAQPLWLIAIMLGLLVNSAWLNGQDDPDKKQDKEDLSALFMEANQDLQAEDFKAAAEKLKKVVAGEEDNEQARFLYGYASHMAGDLDTSIDVFKKLSKSDRFGSTALYNLGCAYSLKGETAKSLEFLHKAMDEGFNQFEMFESDEDLKNVRKVDGFKEVMARADNGGDRPDKKFDAKALVGTWTLTNGQRQGEEVAQDRLPEVVFTAKDVTIPAGEGQSFVMSYKIVDTTDGMIKVDLKIESGPVPEGSALGIMKVDGDKAKFCYDPNGLERPKDFKTTEENGYFCFTMKKKAESFDPAKVVGKWTITEGMRSGEQVAPERMAGTITFEKDKIKMPAGEDMFVMSYKINTDVTPAQIDMTVDSGPAPEGSEAVGIVAMKAGKFVLCYNGTGGARPDKFESTQENECFMFVMKPKKDD